MPAPYSDALRQKVLAAIESGNRKSHVSLMFHISRKTLDLWLKRRAVSGSVDPIRHYQRGPQPKIANLEQFRAFAQPHGHLTPQDMAEQWVDAVSDRTIGKALARLGFTRKKELWLPRTG